MEHKKTYIRKDERSCYRAPDDYFDNLTAQIVTKMQQEPVTDNSWGGAFRRLMGFVAGFVVMVGLAATAFYFTPEAAMEQHKELAQSVEVEEFTVLYNVSEDDILDYYFSSEQEQAEQEQQNAQFAMAIDEYLTTYPMDSVNEDDFDF